MTETPLLESTHRPGLTQEPAERGGEVDPRLREFCLWLHALRSFFNVRNHPLTEADRADLPARDFRNEALIAQGVLRRSAQLISGALGDEPPAVYQDAGDFKAPDGFAAAGPSGGDNLPAESALLLATLSEPLGDVCALVGALLEAPSLAFDAWASLGSVFARQLELLKVDEKLAPLAEADGAAAPHPSLLELTERLTPDALGADMLAVFSAFAHLLARLRFIEESLRGDVPLKQMLPVFTLVREETRVLLDMIEVRTLRIENLEREVFDVLDGTAYAVRMELRKTFEFELAGLSASRHAPQVYAKVENAHGLLRDCFQQSVFALVQIFEPGLDGKSLFSTFQTKLEQSLALRRDVAGLLRLVRRTQQEQDGGAHALLLERLDAFRDGSLRFLMYKDWESYERFAEEAVASRGAAERAAVLHRFEAYLETLFGQVNMRAVLAEYPFDSSAVEEV